MVPARGRWRQRPRRRALFPRSKLKGWISAREPRIIYPRQRMHVFAFVVYAFDCEDSDFSQRVMDTIEFSNHQWSE